MSDTYGPISKKLLAIYNPQESSWKTSEAISHSDSKKFSKTLPKLGMTQDGQLFELVMLEHPTDESDCSASLNLPTPTASDSTFENLERQGIKGNHNLSLLNAVKLLPTPQARDFKGASTRNVDLNVAVRLLPTPTTQEGSGTHRDHRGDLTDALLPTPTVMNNRETGKHRDWGADLTHGIKCDCKERRIHWN